MVIGWLGFAVCAIGWRVTYRDMKSWRHQFFRQLATFDDLAGIETAKDRFKPEPRIHVD
jgi:hypothetical protein